MVCCSKPSVAAVVCLAPMPRRTRLHSHFNQTTVAMVVISPLSTLVPFKPMATNCWCAAQSVGGGGGVIDGSFRGSAGGSGNSGAINFKIDGDITAQGIDPVGIFAQSSTGSGNQGNINIEVTENSTISTNASGSAIKFSGGADNRLSNRGVIQAQSNLAFGTAVLGGTGNESFFNQGMSKVFGDINLGAGVNLIDNQFGLLCHLASFMWGQLANRF